LSADPKINAEMPPAAAWTPDDETGLARRTEQEERAVVQGLVRRHGWNATSFQVLEPGYRYFFAGPDACVAYVDTGHAWVAAGAPLAEEGRMAAVSQGFIAAARAAGRRACFFATEERFVAAVPLRSFPIGEQPVWNPAAWPAALASSRRLREQLRRARAKGVRVRAVAASDAMAPGAPTRAAVSALVQRWLRSRQLAPMGFLVQIDPLTLLLEHRLFLAERDQVLVALLSMAPIYARRGWLLQHLVRAPDAPNGTTETLIDHAMRCAADDGASLVTLGLAPLAGDVPPALRLARRAGRALFDFEGLRSFRAKLHPARWDRVFLSFTPDTGAVRATADVLAAFARGGLFRFGLRTLLRGPLIVVRLLALLLIPWTALLASADAARWFPHPAIKWAWVGFDVCLLAGLHALQRRWRDGLARALMAAVGADAVLTLFEASAWNAPRAAGLAARAVLAVATAGPVIALATLWRARVRGRGAAPGR
jgi:phosphatidylglycerol lysyltransferase